MGSDSSLFNTPRTVLLLYLLLLHCDLYVNPYSSSLWGPYVV